MMAEKVYITQRRSAIGRSKPQKLTIRALGIKRLHQTVVHPDTPQIRGMIEKVRHLVEVKSD
jgi:large subunit ribosomal protein L30